MSQVIIFLVAFFTALTSSLDFPQQCREGGGNFELYNVKDLINDHYYHHYYYYHYYLVTTYDHHCYLES